MDLSTEHDHHNYGTSSSSSFRCASKYSSKLSIQEEKDGKDDFKVKLEQLDKISFRLDKLNILK